MLVAADLRRLSAGRKHTPAEVLQREGRRSGEDAVIDASAAVKWVVKEPGTAKARALRRHF